MSVNFNNIDKHVYNENSLFFPGSLGNTAIKAAALVVVISTLGVSLYLIGSEIPVYLSVKSLSGAVLISGTVVSAAGATLWYRLRVNRIQKATKTLYDTVLKEEQSEGMKSFLEKNRVYIRLDRPSPTCFLDIEFRQRIEEIFRNKELFEKNFEDLVKLLGSRDYLLESEYTFLADQIIELDEETRNFILQHNSPVIQAYICKLMLNICYKSKVFIALYPQIPDSIKEDILLSLADSCFGYLDKDDDYSTTKHFLRALKLTPNLTSILRALLSQQSPQKVREFRMALSRVYSKEFTSVKNIEASTQLLEKLYPFLTQEQIPRAFYVDTRKMKTSTLNLWTAVVQKTQVATQHPEQFMEALKETPHRFCSCFIDYLKKHWEKSTVQEGIKAICEGIETPTPFSLFVHLNNSDLSGEEEAYIQKLSILELGNFTELHPNFLQVWLKDKQSHTLIPSLVKDYIENEPEQEKVKAFFSGLTLEQKFEWLQSNERKSTKKVKDFNFLGSHNLSWILIRRNISEDSLWRKAKLEACLAGLRERGHTQLFIPIDLLMIWKEVQKRRENNQKMVWLKKLWNWSLKEDKKEALMIALIWVEEILDNNDTYLKTLCSMSEQASTPQQPPLSEELEFEPPPLYTKEEVLSALRDLNLDPAIPHSKSRVRRVLLSYHPDKNTDPAAEELFKRYFPLVQNILRYMTEKELNKTPIVKRGKRKSFRI